eukprot:Hpha_TRINITY_DN16695_c7_g4::TRINITY_DN16695_c7_g4_i1::g.182545::m.182545
MASHNPAQVGRWGLRASEVGSQHEKLKAMATPRLTPWRHGSPINKAAWWGWKGKDSWGLPKGLRGPGMEYRKFMGDVHNIMPFYMGGPMEAVHDENRNRVFHNPLVFPGELRDVRHLDAHITARTHTHYRINLHSREALKVIAKNAYRLTNRRLIRNPHTPHQPVEGPAEISANEMEVLRKQAFLAGIEFPEFPDVKPVEQIDPWDEDNSPYSPPPVDNDKLLDAEMWKDIAKNMKGMEGKIKAHKDNERKRLYAWKQAKITSDLKRARMEQMHIAGQSTKNQQKMKMQEKERQKKLKPWERARLDEEGKRQEQDVSEETDDVVETQLAKKERLRAQDDVLGFKPRGWQD